MNERHAQWIRYTLFSSLLLALDLWVICALLLSHTEPRAAATQEDPVLAEYRRHVTRQMHLLTGSGCFRSTEACMEYIERTPEPSVTPLDFSRVSFMDVSCADELLNKLLLRLMPP